MARGRAGVRWRGRGAKASERQPSAPGPSQRRCAVGPPGGRGGTIWRRARAMRCASARPRKLRGGGRAGRRRGGGRRRSRRGRRSQARARACASRSLARDPALAGSCRPRRPRHTPRLAVLCAHTRVRSRALRARPPARFSWWAFRSRRSRPPGPSTHDDADTTPHAERRARPYTYGCARRRQRFRPAVNPLQKGQAPHTTPTQRRRSVGQVSAAEWMWMRIHVRLRPNVEEDVISEENGRAAGD